MNKSLRAALLLTALLCLAPACKKSAQTPTNQAANLNATATNAAPTPNLDEALKEIVKVDEESIRQNPNQSAGYYNLANTYFVAGKYQEAVAQYKEAIRLDPKEAAAPHYEIGQCYLRLNRYDDALAAFNDSLKLNPNNQDAYREMGDAYAKQNKMKEAVAAYQKAVGLKPDLAEAYFGLGNAQFQLNQNAEAVKSFQQATRLNPKDADAFFNLGNSLSRLKQFGEAIKAYRQTVTLKPEDAEAHLRLAVIYLEQGNRDAATAEYNTIKGLNPQLAGVLEEKLNAKQ